ncbi:MAG: hypothetical protein IJ056_02545 [Acidaminococcaceae bacterium]|nr:hypothetical protein [Acidaminococcaceae bacterium]MBQ9635457.1 hypothetical protein [Acidaminococcaceae bacterium]MBQ9697772.1 hypothetical protein [Acidaminococcaceae bacterium]
MNKKLLAFLLAAAMAAQGTVLAEHAQGNTNDAAYNNENAVSVNGPMGAGDDIRKPSVYAQTDKIFLGTWECTNDPHSTLTIQEANIQTGGYHADFFFYRIANAEAYANIRGKTLEVNQGYVNDNKEFYGIFEKTREGIRFTITKSDFTYLPAGQVYEYKRMKKEKRTDCDCR